METAKTPTTLKVLVGDPVSQAGIEALAQGGRLAVDVNTGLKEDELIAIIPEYAALVVRSGVKVTAKIIAAATHLKVIGRAGVGVDNVDVEAATKRGIIVMNTPGGNTISTAEHAFSLMVSLARRIPQAHATMKAGRWDRKKFEGVELYDKTLAILGMGRIGTEFARRAIAFGMRVVAYDPYLSASRARSLQVELVENLDDAVARADFITLHMPLTPETKYMLNRERLAKAKRGVRIINCARGGLVEEAALLEALQSGQVGGAALDVYETEPPPAEFPLRDQEGLVMTPHLGASTTEAQENVGIEIAEAIGAYLLEGSIRNAVNMPNIDPKTLAVIGPFLDFADKLGRFVSQIAPKRADTLSITYCGKLGEVDTTPLTRSALKGFLQQVGGRELNFVNAPTLAQSIGLRVEEARKTEHEDFTELIELRVVGEGKEASVAGTFYGNKPRIVMINGRHVEARPSGVLLLLENRDRPGIVGQIGTMMGAHKVNIASMSLSRNEAGGNALTVLNLDSVPGSALLAEMTADPDIHWAKVIEF
jgi:D-3-phosphoglycerate dehydrogenase